MKVVATLVDDDGKLLIKADTVEDLAILAFVVSQVLTTMVTTFGEDVALAAAALRAKLADDMQLPTIIVGRGGPL